MGVEENRAAIERFVEETDKHNLDVLDELIAPDAADHNPFPGQPEGAEGVKFVFNLLYGAFPDMKQEIKDVLAEGDRVVIRTSFSGTHQGEFMGMAPTGKSFTVDSIDIVRFGDDGKMVEHWGLFDQMSLMMQLGLAPPPPADEGRGE